jgi:hypothetical protein
VLTSEVPHSKHGDERSEIAVGGRHIGSMHDHMSAGTPEGGINPHSRQAPSKVALKTAEELGIPIPYPTIKPLFVALFMTLMFASLLLIHKDKTQLAVVSIIVFAAAMTASLYLWLTSPLEPEHH